MQASVLEHQEESWCRRFVTKIIDYFECDRILRSTERSREEDLPTEDFDFSQEECKKKVEDTAETELIKYPFQIVWVSKSCLYDLFCCKDNDQDEEADKLSDASKHMQLRHDSVVEDHDKNEKSAVFDCDEKKLDSGIQPQEPVAYQSMVKTKAVKRSGMGDTLGSGFGSKNDVVSDLNSQAEFVHEIETQKVDVRKKPKQQLRNKVTVEERAKSSLMVIDPTKAKMDEPLVYFDNADADVKAVLQEGGYQKQERVQSTPYQGMTESQGKGRDEQMNMNQNPKRENPHDSPNIIFVAPESPPAPERASPAAEPPKKQEQQPNESVLFKVSDPVRAELTRAERKKKARMNTQAPKVVVEVAPTNLAPTVQNGSVTPPTVVFEQAKEEQDLTDAPKRVKKRKFRRQELGEQFDIA